MDFKNLEKEIEKLNAPKSWKDENEEEFSTDSFYCFKYKSEGNAIIIYDSNEYFHMDLDEEIRCIVYEGCKEFGVEYKTPESEVERILDLFKEALSKDLDRTDVIIEWENNVRLIVYLY